LARIKTLEESLCDFKTDGETTAKDLLERAENAEKSEQNCRDALIRFKNSYSEMERKVDKLNARKNKATVERCRITGKLIAEFNGKKYFLEEFRGV
jgi:septal ring factor EnvC (AmiA/AmiB activator)